MPTVTAAPKQALPQARVASGRCAVPCHPGGGHGVEVCAQAGNLAATRAFIQPPPLPCSPCGAPNKAQTPLPCRCLCAPAVPRRRYLQNQTGAHLPNTRQNHSADSLPERSAMSIAGTKQENWQLQFKGPELPHGFQRRAFLFFSKSHLCIAMACRILVLQPGIEPTPSPVTARSPHHWTVGSSRGKGL